VAVVGEDTLDRDAVLVGEPGHRPIQEGARGVLALAGEDFAVGDPCVVVDGDVEVVPAGVR